jgi:hypothetical protein
VFHTGPSRARLEQLVEPAPMAHRQQIARKAGAAGFAATGMGSATKVDFVSKKVSGYEGGQVAR